MVWFNPQSAWSVPTATASPITTQGQDSALPKLDYNFDPFYRDALPEEILIIDDPGDETEETSLNLNLKGTTAPDLAIIEGSDRKQANYIVGDEITNGVSLESVHSGYVILLRDGNREKLSLERTESGLNGGTPVGAPSVQYQAAGSLNPADLLNRISIAPHRDNNRLIGYKIAAKPGFDIKPLGFRDGDIITRIGTQDLTEPGIDLNTTILSAVAGGNPTAQIQRRGRKMTIRIRLP